MTRRFAVSLVVSTMIFLPATAQALEYVPVDFSAYHNGGLWSQAPAGEVVYGGVPFSIPAESPNAWNSHSGTGAYQLVTADVSVNLYGVHEVHTLMNTQWGSAGVYTWVEFFGDGGAYHYKHLQANDDVRDWCPDNAWAGSINGTTTVNVYDNGGSGGQHFVVDKQQFILPVEFHTQTLTLIRFSDQGAQHVQRSMLGGVTALVDAPPIPEPITCLSVVLGGFGVRRYFRRR